jgi:hypothetical protein
VQKNAQDLTDYRHLDIINTEAAKIDAKNQCRREMNTWM